MRRILVSDPLDERAISVMEEGGLEVVSRTAMSTGDLLEAIGDFDGLVVRSATKVTREIIERGMKLKVIGRAGVGLDNVDTGAAREKGIRVINTPSATSISVAELVLALMFALARPIVRGTLGLREGRWEKSALRGFELQGKTLGIIGCGRIGCELGKRACALGMTVLGCDLEGICDAGTLGCSTIHLEKQDDLLRHSDMVSIHVPLTSETRHMINRDTINRMKDGVYLIHCARGGVVQESHLLEALKSGKVAGAAMDVFEEEPAGDNPLLSLDNFIATPHIGAATREGQARAGLEIARLIVEALQMP
jgi:D-3-phosphoglycerate dehydrogenase / 2-oxoglutarate reductase